MKCVNCGADILDDSAFCVSCGAKVEQLMQEKSGKKGRKILLTTGIVLAAVFVVAVIFLLLPLPGKTSAGKQLVYVKDEKLYYVENVKKNKEPVEICRLDYEEDAEWVYRWSGGVKLSEDGKYIYFLDRVDENGMGELCRIKTSKVSKNENKNEKNIEELDSKVADYKILEDSKEVIYMRDGNRLMYLADRQEDVEKDVAEYSLCGNKIVYTKVQKQKSDEYDDLYTVYAYDLKTGNTEELEDDISEICITENSNFIVCQKNEEDGFGTIYVLNAKGDSEVIAKDADYYGSSILTEGKSFYYRERQARKVSLYDCVNDSFAQKDSGIKEPDYKDYLKETTAANAMSEWDFDYYVVRYPEEQDDFINWLYYNDEMQMYSYYNDDDDKTYYYDELLDKWFDFKTDNYDADYEAYKEAESRINLREELKAEKFETVSYDVYYYEAGKEPVLVLEDIDTCNIDAEKQCLLYTKAEEIQGNIPMEEIYNASDLINRLETDEDALAASQYYCKWGQAEGELEIKGTNFSYDVSDDGKTLMLEDGSEDRILTLYEKKGSEIEKVEEIAEDAALAGWTDDCCYYYENVDAEDNIGDLCYYKNGKTTRLCRNVYMSVKLYPDGNYIAYSDYNPEKGGELKCYNAKGDDTRVAYDVTAYRYLDDKCIVYLSDGDLYVYTGKDERKIDRNVIGYECEALDGKYL